jgi:hypothetical protein
MENSTSVQQIFFQHVKDHLPPHLSLVDEVAELLHISIDSAYRRIRAEKALSFDEIRTLCSHFRISLDQLFHLETDTLLFSGKFINNQQAFNFEGYLQGILQLLRYISSFGQKEIQFMSKDVPLFHHFHFPELAAFKTFFWIKTILQDPLYSKRQFIVDEFPPALSQLCTKVIEEYIGIPSREIWHLESIHATLRQIEYYRDTKVFASDQDLASVYDCLQRTIDHVEDQTETGHKFSTHNRHAPRAPFQLYVNEFVLGDNTYFVRVDDRRIVLLNHSVLNTIRTTDPYFTRCTEEHFQNIIRRSTPISGVGEKERNKFFNTLREKIETSRKG